MGVSLRSWRRLDARARSITLIIALFAIGGLAYLVISNWLWSDVSTDDAYVGADVAQVSTRVGGAVAAILSSDTHSVLRGQVLVRLDDADARVDLEQAKADLARAVQAYRKTAAHNATLQAAVATKVSNVRQSEAELKESAIEAERTLLRAGRRTRLVALDAISQEEYATSVSAKDHAQAAMSAASAAVAHARAEQAGAEAELSENRTLLEGTTVSTWPQVASAVAALRRSRLNLARTIITAPISGVVARRRVQVGQQLTPGDVLLSIVPVDRLYVDANFKEGQVGRIRVGQRVTLTSDVYGPAVVYHGLVEGVGGGTGAAFALLPAQNATGNWIKVVQRLPVRVSLTPIELRQHPLRVGLSMKATIHVSGE